MHGLLNKMKPSLFVALSLGLILVSGSPYPDNKAISQQNASPVVTTPLGKIEGAILTSRLGKQIFSFRGIRYAKPPINELRFQPPEPVDKWEGVYNATQDGPACPQPGFRPISEDCLSLNVYTTSLPRGTENPKRPVLVFFHAGGFYSVTGASVWAGPQYLMDQDIVLVTLNYRLGSLGFISTGDKEAPGNNGLKDQVEALKWVRANIASFGGDPDSVTISGYSAGGASVTLHLISPMSKGLFHRAIAMSGSILGNWPISTGQLELAKKQARLVGCPDTNSEEIVKCLKTKSAEEIGDSLSGFSEFRDDPILIWSPVVESDFGQERFLPQNPVEAVLKGNFEKVPVMLGITTDEFAGPAFDVVNNATLLEELDKDFNRIAPIAFIYERDTDRSKNISRELRKFYFGDRPLDNASLPKLAQLYADGVIGFGVNRAAKLLTMKNSEKVYYYKFNFKGRYSHFYLPGSNGTVPYGVVHHDDLIYLFYISALFPKFTDKDPETQTVEKLTTLVANFAKNGNPTSEHTDKLDDVDWKPFTIDKQQYLDIGNKLIMEDNLYTERYNEWEKLFPLPNDEHPNHTHHG